MYVTFTTSEERYRNAIRGQLLHVYIRNVYIRSVRINWTVNRAERLTAGLTHEIDLPPIEQAI
mgnify:CR=1 FL=1